MNDDELYVFDERLAILCGNATPTAYHLAIARADVERFGRELEKHKQLMEILAEMKGTYGD